MHRIARPVAVGVSPQAVPVASCRKDPEARRTMPSGTFLGSLPELPLILLACLTLLGPATAQDEAANDLPKNIRVIVEYIEIPNNLLTEVMTSPHADSGPKLHARMRTLMTDGNAKVLETSIVTCRSGQKAAVGSVMEHICPTEYEPPELSGSFGPTNGIASPHDREQRLRPGPPTAFDTRPVGTTLEIEPVPGQDATLINLYFGPELVDLLRDETWLKYHDRWGDASIRQPIYESLRIRTSVTLSASKWGFVGLHTPHRESGGRDTTRKIMLFVRADVMTIGS
jgi:hypothetical protein